MRTPVRRPNTEPWLEGSGCFGVASRSLHRKYASGLCWIAPGYKPSDYSMVVFDRLELYPGTFRRSLGKRLSTTQV
ncbi:hypothetical protein EMIT0P74_10022 [Pseudomonas sp. IT-P74]